MIALTEADDTFETFLRDLEAQGSDIDFPLMREAREANREILSIVTGDPTPPPGALRLVEPVLEPIVVFAPPLHEGWNEPLEGSKFILPRGAKPDKHVTFRELCRQVRHFRRVTYTWLIAITLFVAGAVLVLRWNW